jgi:hypothetical protein
MQIPVLVESLGLNRFRAQAPPPFDVTADGATSSEAVEKLREKMAESMAGGKQVVAMEIPAKAEHPWMPYVGQFAGDPQFDAWQEAIAEYRHQRAQEDAE